MKIRTLVVDNNPVLLRAISAILEKLGCEVKSAVNGLDALNVLKDYAPDILFTDLVMPLVDGEQLCKILRKNEKYSDIFLVVVSGIILEDLEHLLAAHYYDMCIAKGNLRETREHLQEALDRYIEYKDNGLNRDALGATKIPNGLQPSAVAGELLSEKRHLNNILENIQDGIVELNSTGIVVFLNGAAERMLGLKQEQIVGTAFSEYHWGDHQKQIRTWLYEQLPKAATTSLEIDEDRPLQIHTKILTASFIPVRSAGSVFALCILRDITRQYLAEKHEKELDDAFKLIKKMDAMSYMAGGIAHDFTNLLTIICGNLDILILSSEEKEGQKPNHLISHARDAAYMAVDLTRKISCFSPFGIISRNELALEPLVEQTVKEFFHGRPANVALQLADERSIVNIDPDQIQGAIRNVLTNALEAGGEKPVVISTKEEHFESPIIFSGQYVPAGSYACVAVKDSGIGIDREHLLQIFDPYYSTKQRGASKGMGLGLTVVYAAMRNHGGHVVVESTPGCGTTVLCYLPRFSSEVRSEEIDNSKGPDQFQVLVIEKDLEVQGLANIMLEHLGHEPRTAGSLQEGLDILKKYQAHPKSSVQVVLLDTDLNTDKDPGKISRTFKSINTQLKIILTGNTLLDPAMRNCRSYGYANALAKPFSIDNLKHVLETVMENQT